MKWVELNNDTEITSGGAGNYLPHHVPQYAFDDEYDTYAVSGNADELELSEEVLYYIDAFFIKDFSGGISSRAAAKKATEPPVAQQQTPQETEAVFRLFPNPASDEINMMLTLNESGSLEITLSDMNGRQVYRHYSDYVTSSGTQWIRLTNLQNLADGVYIQNS